MIESLGTLLATVLVAGVGLAMYRRRQRIERQQRDLDAQIKPPRRMVGAEAYDPVIAARAVARHKRREAEARLALRRRLTGSKPVVAAPHLREVPKDSSIRNRKQRAS